MDAVKAFNNELSSLYDVKPPISKAKMNSLTRGAIKAIKFYKHVVQSVEKFIQKCKPEYKVPGLYVIDSVVRQSRHQFGPDKDVFAPRFAKNMQQTFLNLLKCPPDDKSKVIRVLNLWQKNSVFPPEVIQPLFDLADPNHPIHKEQSNGVLNAAAGNNVNVSTPSKTSPSTAKNTPKDQKNFTTSKPIDPLWLAQTKMETANLVNANKLLGQGGTNQMDVSFLDQLQHLQQLLLKNQESASSEATQSSSVKFDRKLLDFDYGEEEDDDVATSPKVTQATIAQQSILASASNNIESLGFLLTNPEVLRQIQALQQTMQYGTSSAQNEIEEKMRKLQQMKQQEEEFDKHLAQTVPTLPFASECELKPSDVPKQPSVAPPPPPPPPVVPFPVIPVMPPMMTQDMSQPPPGYPPTMPFVAQPPPPLMRPPTSQINMVSAANNQPVLITQSPLPDENSRARRENSVEIVNCESSRRSESCTPDRYRSRRTRSRSPRHRRKSRSRTRSRSKSRSRSRSSSISRSRRRRSRSRDRRRDDSRDKMNDEEREKDRERRKRGLPPLLRDKLSVCSTTLWVGHLSKLVHQEELSDTFGEIGDIVSIDLISPRGCAFICMNRRQDAYKALNKLKNHKMQGKAITLAWAPGKGVKGKDWKDYWEVEQGVSYIPWNKLTNISDQDLELLEEGGMIDEESMPPWLKGRRKRPAEPEPVQVQVQVQGSAIPTVTDGVVQQPPPTTTATPMVDTSQPPPIRAPTTAPGAPPGAPPAAPMIPPPGQLPMMPPGFTMPPGMLGPMGLQMTPGLMGNVPLGVPPPNMQGLMPGMMQQMMQSVNSPFGLLTQIPMPTPAAPSDKPNATGMPHNVPPIGVPPPTSETGMPNLPMLRQPFGVPPMPMQQMPPQPMSQQQNQRPQEPQQQQQQQQQPQSSNISLSHSDDMDVEMEDAMVPPKEQNKQPSLSDQLLAAMKSNNGDRDDRDGFRDRDNRRDRDTRNDRDRGMAERGMTDRGMPNRGMGDRNMPDRNMPDRNMSDRGMPDRGMQDRGMTDRDRDGGRGNRDRGRGRDRGGRDVNDRRNNRDNRDRDDRRDRDRDMRQSPMREMMGGPGMQGMSGPGMQGMGGMSNLMNDNDQNNKNDMGPKLSLADRLRQLADGTLPLMDDRNRERDMRGPGPNRGSSMDRGDRHATANERMDRGRAGSMEGQPPNLIPGPPRRSNDGPPSLLDLPPNFPGDLPGKFPGDIPAKFPGPPGDFGGPGGAFGGPRGGDRDLRDFPPRVGPGINDRDNRPFGPRGGPMGSRGGPIDDFSEPPGPPGPPRSLLGARFGPMDDFDVRMGGPPGGKGGPPGRPEDFDLRPGGRDKDVRPPPGRPIDEFERGLLPRGPPGPPFDFDLRGGRNVPPGDMPPFDIGRGPLGPDDFEMRDMADYDRRRDFFMGDKFGPPGPIMGPRGPRGMMGGPDNFGPRGRGLGPMFHRGMGPRGMRPGMRPPFGSRGGPMPFDGPEGPFFREGRPGAFDDGRPPPLPLGGRGPPFGMDGPPGVGPGGPPPRGGPGGMPPPLMATPIMGPDAPWRNEGGPPHGHRMDDAHKMDEGPRTEEGRDIEGPDGKPKDEANKHERDDRKDERDSKREERENRRRENRKSRWGNASPSANEGGNNEDQQSVVSMTTDENPKPTEKSANEESASQPGSSKPEHQSEQTFEKPSSRQESQPWNEEMTSNTETENINKEPHNGFGAAQRQPMDVCESSKETFETSLREERPQERAFEPHHEQESFEPSSNRGFEFSKNQELTPSFEAPPEKSEPPQIQERFESHSHPFEPTKEKFEPPPQEFEPPTERFEPLPTQERFEPPPQEFEPPKERFEPPPSHERFEPPAHSFEAQQELFESRPSEKSFEPSSQTFEPPKGTFVPPSHSFEPPPREERFEPPSQSFEPLPTQEKFEAPSRSFEPPQDFETPRERFEPPTERNDPPPEERFERPAAQEFFDPPKERFEPPVEKEHFEPPAAPVQGSVESTAPAEAVSLPQAEEQTTEA